MKRAALSILAVCLAMPVFGEVSPEYKLKAALLFNFAKFVDWPPTAYADVSSPVVIGVLGDDPFDGALDEIVRGRTANGRPLKLLRSHRIGDLKTCHVLFISGSGK